MGRLNKSQRNKLNDFVKEQYSSKNPPKNASQLQDRIKKSKLPKAVKELSAQTVRAYVPSDKRAPRSGAAQARSTTSNPQAIVPKKGETRQQASVRTGKSTATIGRAVARLKKAAGPSKTKNYEEK